MPNMYNIILAPVVQKVENAIQQINLYSLDNGILVSLILIHFMVIYPVDSPI